MGTLTDSFHSTGSSSLFQIAIISLWIAPRIVLTPALISSAGIWSIPGDLWRKHASGSSCDRPKDEGFCVVLEVYKENAELVANFTLHRMLIMQPYQYQRQSSAPVHSSHRYRNLTIMQPPSPYKPTAYTSDHMKSQHISSAAYPGHSTSCHLSHVNFQGSNLSATYIYQKDERALFGNLPLRYVFFPCNECSVSTRTLLFFKTLIFHVIWCPVAMWNFSTERVLRGKFVSEGEEERINCVVKSHITFEIHEGLWNAGRWNGGACSTHGEMRNDYKSFVTNWM
jgi:hypothetical protein